MADAQKNTISPGRGKIFVFSAASGAGKTTLLDYLRKTVPNLVYSISATTRPPRKDEIDGSHYFFLSEDEFQKKIVAHEFAEWATVHGYHYGTPRDFIDNVVASGKHIIMDIDVVGKKQFDVIYPEAVGIFILPPSIDVLRKRLQGRNTDSQRVIDVRVANAVKEIEFAKREGKYEFTIVNDSLEKAKSDVVSLVRSVIG